MFGPPVVLFDRGRSFGSGRPRGLGEREVPEGLDLSQPSIFYLTARVLDS